MLRITNPEVQSFELEHIKAVRKAAPECALFLRKDDTTLPITAREVALYGSGARKTIKGGTGSGDVNVRHFVTIEEGLENAGFTITSKEWLDGYDRLMADGRVRFVEQVKKEAAELGMNAVMYGMGKPMPEPEYELPISGSGNTAIYVLSRISGEGSDRSPVSGDINLSATEIRDILTCRKKYEKFVLVLNVGGMVNLEPVYEVENILLLGQLGTPTGDALADILLGKSNPSGKLAMTWAPIEAYPSTTGFGDMDDTVYNEGIYVGYRYFDTVGEKPTFPFGFGLSYTNFEIDTEDVSADETRVSVKVKVKNTGSHSGKEVVQLYVSAPDGKLDKPYQELRAFVKTGELEPGEAESVTLSFDTADLASYDEETASYIIEPGKYVLRVGNSSRDTKACAVVSLDGTAVIRKCRNICGGAAVKPLVPQKKSQDMPDMSLPEFVLSTAEFETKIITYTEKNPELPAATACTWSDVTAKNATVDQFVGSLSNEQLAYLSIGLYEDNANPGSMIGAAAKSVAGAAGETTDRLKELGVPTLVMADGPAGLRLCTEYKVVGETIKAMSNPLGGILEFLEPEELQQMAAMMPKPSEEELAAPVNYTYCIAIPIGTALAQSFNTEVCKTIGDIVGEEMEMFGIHLWLAPAMNIQRSPLCGRDFEYFSEDPVVSGRIAAAITLGVQAHRGCGTTIKHYALNNQETNRMASNSIASERAIREIYLRNYEICIKESAPHSIMSSYNLVNGEHANNRKDLLTYVLRDEWNYDGIVMTDWYAAGRVMVQDGSGNKHGAALQSGCVSVGNDLTMPGMADDFNNIMEAVDNPESGYPLTRGDLQATAKRVLNTILRLNM